MQRLFDKLVVSCSPFRTPSFMDAMPHLQQPKPGDSHSHDEHAKASEDECGENCGHDHGHDEHGHEHGHAEPAVAPKAPPDSDDLELPEPAASVEAVVAAPQEVTPEAEAASASDDVEKKVGSEAPWRQAITEAPTDLD